MVTVTIAETSVDEPDVAALVTLHHAEMGALSPAESMHALDVAALRHPSVALWAARDGDDLVGIAALAALPDGDAEIKSMRVADRFRGTGAGRMLLRHLIETARARGIRVLWLETGADDAWVAARTLYASEGFTECSPFGSYRPDPASTFMTRAVQAATP